MSDHEWTDEIRLLHGAGAPPDAGLSEAELKWAESHYGFRFPPDLRALLAVGLPRGRCPNWREVGSADLDERMSWPIRGVLFDVAHDAFWWPAWGPRPAGLDEALAQARRALVSAPILIPLYGHRYLPSEPSAAGNPVLSVYQTDIVCYGRDLRSYIQHEFAAIPWDQDRPVGHVPFWSDLLDAMSGPST